MHRLGVHLSIARGIEKIFDTAFQMGCNCTQIFSHSPRSWHFRFPSDEQIEKFRYNYRRYDIKPVFVHQSYLVNLASPNRTVYMKSIDSIKREAQLVGLLGIRYIVIHPGSHLGKGEKVGLENIVNALNSLSNHLEDVEILVEMTAGSKNTIGSKFEHIEYILDNTVVESGVVLDTCHLFAAGYDIKSEEGLDRTVEEFEARIGMNKLKLIHLNDSKYPFGSNKDRHEHIGLGEIGVDGFRRIVNHRKLRNKPMILETPMDGVRSDEENLKVIKSLIDFRSFP